MTSLYTVHCDKRPSNLLCTAVVSCSCNYCTQCSFAVRKIVTIIHRRSVTFNTGQAKCKLGRQNVCQIKFLPQLASKFYSVTKNWVGNSLICLNDATPMLLFDVQYATVVVKHCAFRVRVRRSADLSIPGRDIDFLCRAVCLSVLCAHFITRSQFHSITVLYSYVRNCMSNIPMFTLI